MTRRGILLYAISGIAWGIPFYLVGIIVRELGPTMTVFLRMSVGGLVLLPIAIRMGVLRAAVQHWRWVLLFALLQLAVPWWLVAGAQCELESGMTSLLMTAIPLFNIVFSQVGSNSEVVSRRRLSGLVLGIIGVGLLVFIDHGAGKITMGAVLIVLLATMGYALAPRVVGAHLTHVPSLGSVTLALAFSSLIWLGPAISQWPTELPSTRTLIAIATLGVVCTSVAFVSFFELIKEIGPTRTSFLAFINPTVAVIVGVVIGAEEFTRGMLIGIPLILLGTYLAVALPRSPIDEVSDLAR